MLDSRHLIGCQTSAPSPSLNLWGKKLGCAVESAKDTLPYMVNRAKVGNNLNGVKSEHVTRTTTPRWQGERTRLCPAAMVMVEPSTLRYTARINPPPWPRSPYYINFRRSDILAVSAERNLQGLIESDLVPPPLLLLLLQRICAPNTTLSSLGRAPPQSVS